VAFVGFEWTQVSGTPASHYGHKNVIFPGLDDSELPTRPISALPDDIMQRAPNRWLLRIPERLLGSFGLGEYADFLWLVERLAELPNCEKGVASPELPRDCRENADTPAELFRKLDEWGLPALVIPHGLTWGIHAPPGARLDPQLRRSQHDPERQRLLEIYSGHGNSEPYRAWRPAVETDTGEPVCGKPTRDYLPCCWQAGEIMRSRCGDLPQAECEARVREARRLALLAGTSPHLVFPDARPEDWLDCDQCRDCFKPAFALRPMQSAQYSLAISGFETSTPQSSPLRFRWGFVGSSDDHEARPGTGFKQILRKRMSDARGVQSPLADRVLRPLVLGKPEDPQRPQAGRREGRSFAALLDVERVASYMYPGGLAAVHARGRSRNAIWEALQRREVYATSGPRILLWFDLLNGEDGPAPMGSEVRLSAVPRFRVRAAGAFVQQPGCPRSSLSGLPADRLKRLCKGECYNPGDTRHRITAIEVVRILPQQDPRESVGPLISDPWRRFVCGPDPEGCVVEFEDPEYPSLGREAIYYVRALQEPTPAINGAGYRTEFDAEGRAVRTRPCHGSYRTPADDDCLAPVEERAWSSPIFVGWSGSVSERGW
ncbi:MAG: DUF3604 domain-containing protein, partial [Myxococcota bacterium]